MKITVKGKEYDLEELHITGNCSEEREVTVTTTADEDIIHVYTSDDVYLTRLKKFLNNIESGYKIVNIVAMKDGQVSGIMIEAPKRALSFISGAKPALSDKQRMARSAWGKKLHEIRK